MSALAFAALVPSLFFISTPTQAPERATPDKWQPATNQPLFKTAQNQYLFPTFVIDGQQLTIVERSTVDKWQPRPPDLFRLPQNRFAFPSLAWNTQTPASGTETITVDKWYRLLETPLFSARRWPHLFPAAVIDSKQLTQAERPTPDKWQPATNQPLFDLKRSQATFPVSLLHPLPLGTPATSVEAAVQPTNQPLFATKHFEHLFPTLAVSPQALTLKEALSVDRWFTNPLNPPLRARAHSYVFPAGLRDTRIIAPETVTLDKWFRETGRPVFIPKNHWYLEYFVHRDIVINHWRPVNRSSDASYNGVTRSTDASYNPVSRPSDDSWNNVPRET